MPPHRRAGAQRTAAPSVPRPARAFRGRAGSVVVAALAALAAAAPVQAFRAVPPDAPHDLITAEAAKAAGWPDRAVAALQQAVRRPDVDEASIKAGDGAEVVVLDASADYEPAHHCDRLPQTSHQDAFAAAARYVHTQRTQAQGFAEHGDVERALRALGNALHALQDCFSHSNIVDLPAPAQAEALDSLLDAQRVPAAPPGLLLCAFQPGAEEAEFPAGDAYPHGTFNKDGPNSTQEAQSALAGGETKHEAARRLATEASSAFLAPFTANLSAPARQALFALEEKQTPSRIPHPAGLALAALLGAAAFVRAVGGRRRP